MSLADLIAQPQPPALEGTRRVHRIGRPNEDEEQPAPPREAEMPSGVYPRKPRGEAVTDATTIDAKGEPKRKAPAPKKPAKKRTGVTYVSTKARASGGPVTAATFVVNDRGAMGILAGEQRIDLEPADVKRLEQFLTNSKGLRR